MKLIIAILLADEKNDSLTLRLVLSVLKTQLTNFDCCEKVCLSV